MNLDSIFSMQSDARLLEKRSFCISEAINAAVAKRVVSNLLMLETMDQTKPITIYLNSPGGEVTSGFAIYDTIRFIKSPVYIVCAGLCASIATVILCAAEKKHRYTMPNSKFLIHQPLIPGQVYGQASDLEITAREILKTRQKINELLSKECGQPLEKVEADTTRDYWMSSKEAVDYGLVTKVVESIGDIK
jgi:ATP-dependent Clp protease protease subunit